LTNYLSMKEAQGSGTHRLVQKPSQAVQKGRPRRPSFVKRLRSEASSGAQERHSPLVADWRQNSCEIGFTFHGYIENAARGLCEQPANWLGTAQGTSSRHVLFGNRGR